LTTALQPEHLSDSPASQDPTSCVFSEPYERASISGATSKTYTLASIDGRDAIRVRVTAENAVVRLIGERVLSCGHRDDLVDGRRRAQQRLPTAPGTVDLASLQGGEL